MSLFRSLKERKVVQWLAAYLAGAWLVREVVSEVGGSWGMPMGVLRGLDVVLAIGVLVTLLLAWYHGEKGRQRVSGPELLILSGVALVATILLRLLWAPGSIDTNAAEGGPFVEVELPRAPAIAVLPFESRGGEEADEHFAAGVHEEVLAQLGKIRSLEVKSRTSVLGYADSPPDVPTIGEELGAQYIVEAGVQRGGGLVRMNVSLVDATSDALLWNESYERELSVANVLDIQREVALAIATSVGAEILPGDQGRLDVQAPEDLVAYERYLEGLSHQQVIERGQNNEAERIEARARAIEALGEAIEREPDWAPPYAALGRVYHFMASVGIDPAANYSRSRTHIDRAFELDSLSAPTWSSHAFLLQQWERDLLGALAAYERMNELFGIPLGWGAGILYRELGRYDESVAAYEVGVARNPLASGPQSQLGVALMCAGEYDRAIRELERGVAMRGDSASVGLAYSYMEAGAREEGLAQIRRLNRSGTAYSWMALLYASADSTERAEGLLAQALEEPPRAPSLGPTAATYLALDRADAALDYLERATESLSPNPGDLMCPAELRSLQGDPRYDALLRRFTPTEAR